jgi:hypothetical protein
VSHEALSPQQFKHLSPLGVKAAQAYGLVHPEHYEETTVPTEELKHKVMQDPEIAAHGSFDAYHRWYKSMGDVPQHTERWPVIEGEGHEALEDGWHRFHSYVAQGDKHIPMLRKKR